MRLYMRTGKGDHVIFFFSRVQRGDGGASPLSWRHGQGDLVIGGAVSHKGRAERVLVYSQLLLV